MKTLSVKQVAEVLGVSPRAIHKRLASGTLKGTRRLNKFGVEEWWVYPNKEIRGALEEAGRIDILGSLSNEQDAYSTTRFVEDVHTVDIDNFEEFGEGHEPTVVGNEHAGPVSWERDSRAAAGQVAEDLWSNLIARFLEKIEEKDQLIGEMRVEISDKDRRLKLLPDLQRTAEEERKAAELKELEAEALRKQIAAMEEEQIRNEERLHEEAERLRSERETAVSAVKAEVERLSIEMEKLRKPWWKRMFSAPEDAKTT